MKNVVIGGTGTVGSLVVNELLARKEEVRVVTRSAEKAKALPAGVEGVVADLTDPTTLDAVFANAQHVFMANPVGMTETHEGLLAVNFAKAHNVKRFVYLSVHHMDQAVHIPHFGSKLPIETALKSVGLTHTILRPNNFYQNDAWMKDALTQYGVYGMPIGDIGCSRVDARDIAELAVLAMTHNGHENKTYNVVGPQLWNGAATAEIWGSELGKKVSYVGNDLDAWEKSAASMMPAFMVYDMKIMFRFFQEKGLKGTDADLSLLTKLLGHAPRSFGDFVNETVQAWK
jgi:uncharacterized protein YbjT (DUF2867 family)